MLPALVTAAVPSLISGASSIVGGMMTSSASNKAARLNAMFQAQQAQIDREINEGRWQEQLRQADIDRGLQKEFAQHGIQWKTQDALAAGIHPLFAMGAQTASSSPISISAPTQSTPSISPYAGASPGASFSAAGQDLGRAMQAMQKENDTQQAVLKTEQDLRLENMGLQNQLLATQIAKLKQPGTGPGLPSSRMMDGQGNSPLKGDKLTENKRLERVVPHPTGNSQEPNFITEQGYSKDVGGHSPNMMSKDAKDRLEEDIFGILGWNIRNRLAPALQMNMDPPKHVPLKDGHRWVYNPVLGRYEQRVPLFGKKGFQPREWWKSYNN